MEQHPIAKLALADGAVFTGFAFGYVSAPAPVTGEVVFNTSMTGYQEILTDPSYAGQIVTMTYPLIGNYGVNRDDVESKSVHARGFVVRQVARRHQNHRANWSLGEYLAREKVLGIQGVDTRALTRRLRSAGVMNGVISASELDDAKLVAMAKAIPSMAGQNLACSVSRTQADTWTDTLGEWAPAQGDAIGPGKKTYKVVALDCGAKSNILRHLTQRGCEVIVLPHDASADTVMSHQPDGLFISNGPGDPEPVERTVATLRALHGKLPMFGICLGHQLLALSLGAKTYKLKFGHRGGNQPVQNLGSGKVEITSQNHGFAVDTDSLAQVGAEPTHINLNDGTLAGFRHTTLPIFAIQYHPEASPGPHDASYLFDCFIDMMTDGQSPNAERMSATQRRAATVTRR